jgi:MFS superfamily sulfate permease-like transporter
MVGQIAYLATSHLPTQICGSSSTATPFIASAIASMIAHPSLAIPANASPEQLQSHADRMHATIFGFLPLTGLLSGTLIYLCGNLRLSRFLHFFPFPVTKYAVLHSYSFIQEPILTLIFILFQ